MRKSTFRIRRQISESTFGTGFEARSLLAVGVVGVVGVFGIVGVVGVVSVLVLLVSLVS